MPSSFGAAVIGGVLAPGLQQVVGQLSANDVNRDAHVPQDVWRGPRYELVEEVRKYRRSLETLSPSELPCEVPVEDVRKLGADDFSRKYADAGRPVVLSHITEGWGATAKWSKNIFLRRFANVSFAMQDNHARSHPARRVSLQDSFSQGVAEDDNYRFFLREAEAADLHKAIEDDVRWPTNSSWPPPSLKRIRGQRILSIGSAGTSNRIHKHADAWQAQVYGLKLWWLVDPRQVSNGGVLDEFEHWGPDVCKFLSRRPGTAATTKKCVVGPGSAMFVPQGLLHGTCNLDDWSVAYGAQGAKAPLAYMLAVDELSVRNSLSESSVYEDGMLFIHWAASDGNLAMLSALVDQDANSVREISRDGMQPLHFAAKAGQLGAVDLLLNRGASAETLGGESMETAIHMAAGSGHANVVTRLLANLSVESKAVAVLLQSRQDGATALHRAAANCHVSVLEVLLSLKGLPEDALMIADAEGWLPSHWAANAGCDVAVDLLVARAAGVGEAQAGISPIQLAAWSGNARLVKLLLRAGADVNARSSTGGGLPLHSAASNGHVQLVKLLQEHGGDVAGRDFSGRTPLHWAAAFGRVKAASALLKDDGAGQLLNAVDLEGAHALHVAARNGHARVIQLLLFYRADVGRRVSKPEIGSFLEIVLAFLTNWFKQSPEEEQKRALRDDVIDEGRQPLTVATMAGHISAVKALLESGAQVIDGGVSNVALAVQSGHLEIARVLGKTLDCKQTEHCPSGMYCGLRVGDNGCCVPCPDCCKSEKMPGAPAQCPSRCACAKSPRRQQPNKGVGVEL